MNVRHLVSQLLRGGAPLAILAVALTAASVSAATIASIEFTGLNLVYDGSSIVDAGSPFGGARNPAFADPLTTADFKINGILQGSINTDLSLDLLIPDVTGILSGSGTVFNTTTVGNPGYFDLLIGTGPSAAQYIQVDLSQVNVTYIDVMNLVQFSFGAAISDTFVQNLPFGLQLGDPVTVSFSAQVDPGTRTTGGGLVTGFRASGTGEIRGPQVPEPASCALAACGLIAIVAGHRRK